MSHAFKFCPHCATPLALISQQEDGGVNPLLPLAAVVCYITRQAQYTSSNILQRTLYTFFHLTEQKNSLTTRCARAAASATRPLRLTPRGWAPGARVAKWRRS